MIEDQTSLRAELVEQNLHAQNLSLADLEPFRRSSINGHVLTLKRKNFDTNKTFRYETNYGQVIQITYHGISTYNAIELWYVSNSRARFPKLISTRDLLRQHKYIRERETIFFLFFMEETKA